MVLLREKIRYSQTGCNYVAFSGSKASIFVRKTLQVLPCEIKKL